MGLKLRYFPESGLIRSVGDAPNGILCVLHTERPAAFAVNPTVDPPEHLLGGNSWTSIAADGIAETSEVLDLAEVAAAAVDKETLSMLWATLIVTGQRAFNDLTRFDPEPLRNLSELAVDFQPHAYEAMERFRHA